MTQLGKLTLYLRLRSRNRFFDGKDLSNEILVYIPQLHTFIFYISTEDVVSSTHPKPIEIQQTLSNIQYGQATCVIDYYNTFKAICHLYSLPFTFTHLGKITNNFPNIVYDTVTHLHAYDIIPMEHEFFMRISHAFPLLKSFSVKNDRKQRVNCDNNLSYLIIIYPHLISLNIMYVHMDYLLQFLLETKTHLPRLTKLKVNCNQLKTVTMNFTRDSMRRNCSNVKRLIIEGTAHYSKDLYQYFPSL
jgi:hypothetical protein